MKKMDLYEMMTDIDDKYVEETKGYRPVKKRGKMKYLLLVAALCVACLGCAVAIKAAPPLVNHSQVHEVAAAMDADNVVGMWKYDNFDAYIEILEDGQFYYLGSDLKRDTAFEYKVLDDCVVLYNEFGGEDTVLYFTDEGKLVDAGGDGLTMQEGVEGIE